MGEEFPPEVDMLIEMVKQRPFLIDMKHPLYKDTAAKERAWAYLGAELNVPGEEAKKQWILIRDNFQKRHKKLKEKSLVTKKRRKQHCPEWYDKMLWYLKYANVRKRFGRRLHTESIIYTQPKEVSNQPRLILPKGPYPFTTLELPCTGLPDTNGLGNGAPTVLAAPGLANGPTTALSASCIQNTDQLTVNCAADTRILPDTSDKKSPTPPNTALHEKTTHEDLAEEHFAKSILYELKQIPPVHRMDCKLEIMKVLRNFQVSPTTSPTQF